MFYKYFCTCNLVYFDSLIELYIILTIFVQLLGRDITLYYHTAHVGLFLTKDSTLLC